jgi:hypothetical protein
LKLVNSLSRLLVPLKLDSKAEASVGPAVTSVVAVIAAGAEPGMRRAALDRTDTLVALDAVTCVPGWIPVATLGASEACPAWVVSTDDDPLG